MIKFFTDLHLFYCLLMIGLFTSCKEVLPPAAFGPVPNENQMAWHELEQYAFVHFTTNTFTDKEWGYGDEQPAIFNPSSLDAEQWAKNIKEAGLKALILTCKHHDGFCLWPSKYTEHSVKNSPFRDGKGDVVKEVSDACRKYGLKFGIYLSPWDRNSAQYGTPEYIIYYRNQLRELLSGYGDIFEVWFDGANGGDGFYGGARETRRIDNETYYDWTNTCTIVRELAPTAMIFSDAGPDIRWCGNESGFAGETNWSTISMDTLFPGKSGIEKLLNQGEENGNSWCPIEVDVSIHPWKWFYHENSKVKTPETLFNIYMESVGHGANLLLNIPPDRRGLIHDNDIQALKGWKKLRDEAFADNLAKNATIKADTERGNSNKFAAKNAVNGDKNTYWATDDDKTSGTIEIDLAELKTVKYIVIQEYIRLGQRVKTFSIEARRDNRWDTVAEGTTVGYKRIISLDSIKTNAVRIKIDAKACPLISNIEIY
ncbi:MAG: alpha-L-fucosidase [Dysgonamonadaceae bacterium]|jgi:alpha-L-fucosidase|nr:alpha-L-fucosidase [Dysgonamonadaceae bacterium]